MPSNGVTRATDAAIAREVVKSDNAAYYGRSEGEDLGTVYNTLTEYADSENVADLISDGRLAELGVKVKREFEVDKSSRGEWEERHDEAMDLAKQVHEEKNYPWPGAANIKYPLLTTASIQFAARAYPAIVNDRNVVKGVVNGSDEGVPAQQPSQGPIPGQMQGPVPGQMQQQWQEEPGAKKARADRIARHMSWQLLNEMEEWEEETDKLLHVLPIVGHAFRKTWYDPGMGRNRSELVTADKCIVNINAKSLETVPRITQMFELYPYEIEERKRMGLYRDVDFGHPTDAEANDDSAPHHFLEQHRYEDLDDDGYPEPYVVTVHKDTNTVARIVARYSIDDVLLNDDGDVAKIEPTHYFTDFRFLPAPDGTYYGIGFGELLKPLNESINTTINQLLDAGHLANAGGGFIGEGLQVAKGSSGVVRFTPGEWKKARSIQGSLSDNVLPLPQGEPSATLFNLLELLINAARDITSVKDVMTGESGPKNEAAARTMARIEQGMKVFSAIYKRIYRSLKQEYQKLYRLNAQYLDQRKYFQFHDDPEAIAPEDYNTSDMDVAPAADPSMITEQQKAAQAEFLMQFLNDPLHDPIALRKRIHEAIGITDYEELVVDQMPQQPDPEVEVKKFEAETKRFEAETERAKAGQEIGKLRAETLKVVQEARKVAQEAEGADMSQYVEALDKIQDNARKFEELEYRWAELAQRGDEKMMELKQRDEADERRVRSVGQQSGNQGGSGSSGQ